MLYDFDAVKIYKGKKGLIFGKIPHIYFFSAYRTYFMGHVLYYIQVIDDVSMTFPLSLLVPAGNKCGYSVLSR